MAPKADETRTWFAVSLPMLMVGGFYLMLTHTDILVLQQFRSPDDIAIYYAASKTIALVSFVYFAVSAAVAHRFTEYHVTGDRQRLAEFLADSIRWTFWPSLAATAAILLMGKPLLALFGALFVAGLPGDVHPRRGPAGARRDRPGRAAAHHARRAAHLRRGLCLRLRA